MIFNDAGVGLDQGGIQSLTALAAIGMPAATADAWSCRIGDGADMLRHGVVSQVNAVAAALGCRVGESVRDCADRMQAATPFSGMPPPSRENRLVVRDTPGLPRVIAVDSASLIGPDDVGAIAITASHGGLIGGDPAQVIKAQVLAAVFHDAGIGKDEAGVGRLPVLAARGIAAATVANDSARIGDARSVLEQGRLSRINGLAEQMGVRVGHTVGLFIDRLSTRLA